MNKKRQITNNRQNKEIVHLRYSHNRQMVTESSCILTYLCIIVEYQKIYDINNINNFKSKSLLLGVNHKSLG